MVACLVYKATGGKPLEQVPISNHESEQSGWWANLNI